MVLDDPDHPFFAIVGNSSKPTWPETAVAFATFYHLIANGHYVSDAVKAMCTASGNESFFLTTAEEAKQVFLDFIKTVNPQEATEELKEEEKNEPPNEFAKRLRAPEKIDC